MSEGRKFESNLQRIITQDSVNKAKKYKDVLVAPKHIALCICQQKSEEVQSFFKYFRVNAKELCKDLKEVTFEVKEKIKEKYIHAKSTSYILQKANLVASQLRSNTITNIHVLISICSYTAKSEQILSVTKIFEKHGIGPKEIAAFIEKKHAMSENDETETPEQKAKIDSCSESQKFEYYKENLIKAGYISDVNARVKKKYDPIIGREQEINRCIQVLCRKKKSNLVILGESGVGKTLMIEGIAKKIVDGDVPDIFKKTEIYKIELSNMIAGSKFRGQFEERMKNVVALNTAAFNSNKKVIMFIDDISTLCNTGNSDTSSVSASTMLKPSLSDGTIRCIGCTTIDEYNKYMVKDRGLSSRFSTLYINEPSATETTAILEGLKSGYEKYYNVEITSDMIKYIVDLSNNFIKDNFFPDKAIDVLDEVCSNSILFNNGKISRDIVENVISGITRIPINSISKKEKSTLLDLENKLNSSVIAQEPAVKCICDAIKRSRLGLKDENKPIGVFLFLGPTGTGKTLCSKKLSEILFGDDRIIRLDMSEYMDKLSVNKITGGAPGYVGYDDGSQLCKMIRKNPYSVLLLDEIEKANKEVLNIFLTIFDEGRLTDTLGRLVDFRNTIIIMTSNLATSKISKRKAMGFEHSNVQESEEVENYLTDKVKEYFSPEFFNRVDSTIIFNKISRDDVEKIFDIEFEKTVKKLKKIGYEIALNKEAKAYLCEKGFDEEYGARPMLRTIQQKLEVPMANGILNYDAKSNDVKILVDIDKKTKELTFNFSERE